MPGAREGFISHVRARAVGSAAVLPTIDRKIARPAPRRTRVARAPRQSRNPGITVSHGNPIVLSSRCAHWKEINDSLNDDVLQSIGLCAANTFVFVHYPSPHAPFIFAPDGSVRHGVAVQWGKAQNVEDDWMFEAVFEGRCNRDELAPCLGSH
jgi:hypothetical protein